METDLVAHVPERPRDGLQGAEGVPAIGGNTNCYVYVYVPAKRVLGFHQIPQGLSSPYKQLGMSLGKATLRTQMQEETGHVKTWDGLRKR